jgi:8-amino-7-oxononanoate synthase
VLDFTSALYLGMRHASGSLQPWAQLTTGVPSALAPPPAAAALAQSLARLQGCERAALAPSTLHLFWDLFGLLGGDSTAIYMDEGLYPVGRWGVERAAARGVAVRSFPHHDADALGMLLLHDARAHRRPIVVTDGFCIGCGRHAPVTNYLRLALEYGGQLVMDDTQAIGIYGRHGDDGTGNGDSGHLAPYGTGGGGTLRRFNLGGAGVLCVSSLAKGFGVPVAILSGSNASVRSFEARSDTRMHCSPPSAAVLHATQHALALNDRRGDDLRLSLAQRVRRFRRRLAEADLSAKGGLFPVQTLTKIPRVDASILNSKLYQLGIRTILHRAHDKGVANLSFILTARHSLTEIDSAVKALICVLRRQRRRINPIKLEVKDAKPIYV